MSCTALCPAGYRTVNKRAPFVGEDDEHGQSSRSFLAVSSAELERGSTYGNAALEWGSPQVFVVNDNRYIRGSSLSVLRSEWEIDRPATPPRVSLKAAILEFNRQLQGIGVDLILVPLPAKIEALGPDFETELELGMPISLSRTKAMIELLENDIEVVDVLPALLAARDDNEIPIYETHGHHLSGLGSVVAGEVVARRLERYDLSGRDPSRFSSKKSMSTERQDRSVPMWAWGVYDAEENPYEHVADSEIVVIGDSLAFAHWTASFASHIARATGIPITDLSVSNGGQLAPRRLAAMGAVGLRQKKAVIWITIGAFLLGPWDLPELPVEPSILGLLAMGQIEEATELFEGLSADDPERLKLKEGALVGLGHNLLNTRHNEEAIAVLTLNTKAFPRSATAFVGLGRGYQRLEQRDEAAASYREALERFPAKRDRERLLQTLEEWGVVYAPPERPVLKRSKMKALTGTYRSADGKPTAISLEKGKLYYQLEGRTRLEILPTSQTTFNSPGGLRVAFLEEDGGMEMRVIFQGQRRSARRESR